MLRNNAALCLIVFLLSMHASALELQDVQAKLYAPTAGKLKGVDTSTSDGQTLLSAVLARSQYKQPSTELSLADCVSIIDESLAIACKLVLLGNSLNDGRLDTYVKVLGSMSTDQRRQAGSFIAELDADVLKSLHDRQVSFFENAQIELNSEDNDFLKNSTDPLIDVEINGARAQALFDTGASVTIISESDALRFGIELVKLPVRVKSYYSQEPLNANYGMIKKIKIAGTEFKNVLVVVGGSLNLIGLDLISSFDNVVIRSDRIVLNLPASEIEKLEAQCIAKVFLGSTYSRQTQFLYLLAEVDGKKTAASIDTGNPYYLSGGGSEVGPAGKNQRSKIITDVNGAHSRSIADTAVLLKMGGVSKSVSYTKLAEQQYLTPHVLGWAAFQDHELIWNTHEARACYKDKSQIQ
ncbi:hypothetical protein HKK55_15645 [Pseudomonas sp. ADAK18]|uniref:retropepsin-like aspartic protease family protein n=1 Tax=Pseudomonas sp. ADAK18 TaxID=2730848 RepID=UPI00146485B4|nr:retropepsin-like aspartic protease [Pseudomonas sp. ADAK18]QJI30071.1 hypothetical protein HKK55_15645 [Pseudomonas sp. ADAK18]